MKEYSIKLNIFEFAMVKQILEIRIKHYEQRIKNIPKYANYYSLKINRVEGILKKIK